MIETASRPTTTFLQAVRSGRLGTVRRMLRHAPALVETHDSQGVSALLLSVLHSRREVTRVLLSAGVTLDLFEAAALGHLTAVKTLLDADRSWLDGFSTLGFTPLVLAAAFGHAAVVSELLDRGANIDLHDCSCRASTPLDAAVAGNHTETALLLLARGARVNVKDSHYVTPLHKAVALGNQPLIKALLAYGADSDGLAIAEQPERPECPPLLAGIAASPPFRLS